MAVGNAVDLARVAASYKDRAGNLNELTDAAHAFVVAPRASAELRDQHLTAAARTALADLAARLADIEWRAENLGKAVKETAAAHGLKMPQVAIPLRVALLGQPQSPAIDAVLEVLGRDEIRARIAAALG